MAGRHHRLPEALDAQIEREQARGTALLTYIQRSHLGAEVGRSAQRRRR
ncbi:hypothetical protein J7E96_27885 [Streptomyces sp. ISL-96]|nr:hypothetical protein [Streptomyces sp. ISL-96]MBT2492263.1 hypothetical protein [Streptomyces sp. ISL-96]